MGDTLEIVEVELSPEGGYLGLVEEALHDDLLEVLRLAHCERSAMVLPRDEVLHPQLLHEAEQRLQLQRKRSCDMIVLVQFQEISVRFIRGLVHLIGTVDVLMLYVLAFLAFCCETSRFFLQFVFAFVDNCRC